MKHWGACQSPAAISEHYTKTTTVQPLSNLSVVIRKHPVNSFGEVGFALNNLWHPKSLVAVVGDHLILFDNCSKWKTCIAPISWFVHHDQTYHSKLIIHRSLYYYYIINNIQCIYYMFKKRNMVYHFVKGSLKYIKGLVHPKMKILSVFTHP